MSGLFVFGLFGDQSQYRYGKVREDMELWLRHDPKPQPLVVYCYGVDNSRLLESLAIEHELVSEEPLVNFLGFQRDKRPMAKGQIVYGTSIWRHKIDMMDRAMWRCGTIVWLDWDTKLIEPLPDEFWGRMAGGKPIQMSLIRYRRNHCLWRSEGATSVPEGALIYVRERAIIDRAYKIYAKHPRWTDQMVFGLVMDEMAGGWPGNDWYKRLGFEPYCHSIYDQLHEPEELIFRTGRRIRQQMWDKKKGVVRPHGYRG